MTASDPGDVPDVALDPAPEAALAPVPPATPRRGPYVAVVVALAAVALGLGWFVARDPSPVGLRPVEGTLGDVLVAEGFAMRVDGVWQADTVLDVSSSWAPPSSVTTSGTWLVVRVGYRPLEEPGAVLEWWWQDAQGRNYTPDERLDNRTAETQPGQWWTVDLVFEVPLDAVGDGYVMGAPDGRSDAYPVHLAVFAIEADEIVRVDGELPVPAGGWREGEG